MTLNETLATLAKVLTSISLSIALAGGGLSASKTSPASIQKNFAPPSVETVLPAAQESSNSVNWAGYVAEVGSYTGVSGTWTIPTVSAVTSNEADATWVGIGGVRSRDLIQAGTEALPTDNGDIVYRAWYELLPGDSHPISLPVSAGDSVSVSIAQTSPGNWLIRFLNNTTGQSYSTTLAYDSALSSAEWIEEMPVALGAPLSLDNFGTVRFTSGSAIQEGQSVSIQNSGAHALRMQNNADEAIAVPSVLGADGSSFSISRTDASASPLALTRRGTVRPVVSIHDVSPAAYVIPQQPQIRISRWSDSSSIVITFFSN